MFLQIFTEQSPYTKRAKTVAWLWTLLIFIACLWPGKELPQVNIRFVDKWVHFILFGTFSFLWLCAYPSRRFKSLFLAFAAGAAFGWLIECLQGWLAFLGRSKDVMDALADGVGSILGVLLFLAFAAIAAKKISGTE